MRLRISGRPFRRSQRVFAPKPRIIPNSNRRSRVAEIQNFGSLISIWKLKSAPPIRIPSAPSTSHCEPPGLLRLSFGRAGEKESSWRITLEFSVPESGSPASSFHRRSSIGPISLRTSVKERGQHVRINGASGSNVPAPWVRFTRSHFGPKGKGAALARGRMKLNPRADGSSEEALKAALISKSTRRPSRFQNWQMANRVGLAPARTQRRALLNLAC
jgi:hypothetical protein